MWGKIRQEAEINTSSEENIRHSSARFDPLLALPFSVQSVSDRALALHALAATSAAAAADPLAPTRLLIPNSPGAADYIYLCIADCQHLLIGFFFSFCEGTSNLDGFELGAGQRFGYFYPKN